MHRSSRSPFLPAVTSITTATLPAGPTRIADLHSRSTTGAPAPDRLISQGWEFRTGPAAGIWEIWRAEDDDLWTALAQSHTAPAGPACYRTRLPLRNPILNGRTVLHFQSAGHSATLWVGPILIGTRHHASGDFVFDITDALARLAPSEAKQGTPIAVLCNNPHGATIPAFRATLAYLPALALDTVSVQPIFAPDGSARIAVHSSLYNPNDRSSACAVSIELLDPSGRTLQTATETVEIWRGIKELAVFRLAQPSGPYRCRITLSTPDGQTHLEECFTLHQPKRQIRFRVPHDHAARTGALSWA